MATAKKAAAKKAAGKVGKSGKSDAAEGKAAKPAPQGKALVTYDEMLAKLRERGQKQAEREANTGAGGMPFMSTEGKNFATGGDDGEDYGDSIQCVVIAASFLNIWYDSKYVRGEKSAPACYATALDEEDMAPPDNVPKKQSDDCASCPLNEWDSGEGGKGKACSNRRRLCVLLTSDLDEGIVRPIMMNLPPTALKFWGRYVKAIARQHNCDPAGVVTRFDFDEDNPQPCPIPVFESMVSEAQLGMIFGALEEAEEAVLTPINTDDYVDPSERAKKSSKLGRKNAKAPTGKAGKGGAAAKKAPARGGRR